MPHPQTRTRGRHRSETKLIIVKTCLARIMTTVIENDVDDDDDLLVDDVEGKDTKSVVPCHRS